MRTPFHLNRRERVYLHCATGVLSLFVWLFMATAEICPPLHEWLHGVCAYFAGLGYVMPDRDADGGARHGYIQSAVSGWTDYYRDLMTRNVLEAA